MGNFKISSIGPAQTRAFINTTYRDLRPDYYSIDVYAFRHRDKIL